MPTPYISSLSRNVEFARHLPVAKLLRRAQLVVRRQIADLMPLRQYPQSTAGCVRAAQLPQPLFRARLRSAAARQKGAWRFKFLNRSYSMPAQRIDWTAPGPEAAHQLWRMNLHYMEYLEEVDDRDFEDLALQWICSNGAPARGTWRDSWNSYAISIRTVVWLQQLARRSSTLTVEAVSRMEASAVQQLRFLAENLETDLCGNHLIKNIKALIWGSCYFDGEEPSAWRTRALDLLHRELPVQILADGLHYERSPSYHAQVFADLLECRHAMGHDPLSGQLADALARMIQPVADLAHPDGGPALFNDAGLTMAYAPSECIEAYYRVIGRTVTPRSLFAYRSAGYFGARWPDSYFVADCGRISSDDLPAHAHGDVLSFEWSIAGFRVIVDQGVFEYNSGDRRARSRSSASHNTLTIDGTDQAEFFGSFRCGRRPNVRLNHHEALVDGFVMEGMHDGFARLPGKPRHVRRFNVTPATIVIDDSIVGETNSTATISFLLHPDVSAIVEGHVVHLAIAAGIAARLTATSPPELEPAVWWPDMGHQFETTRIVIRLPLPLREVRTVLEKL